MPSKLGPHCLKPTDTARQMIDAGCRIIKLVDDFGYAPDLAAHPEVTVIGRVYAQMTAESQRGEDPAAAARKFIDSQKDKYQRNPAVKIWEGHNEPVWNSPDDMQWYARFEIARLKLLADLGLRGVIGCFATGNPGDIDLWRWFIPAVQAAKQQKGILGLHEYSSPWMWWMTGRFQLDPNGNAGDEGWTTLRYRKVIRNYLKPAGLEDVPIAITELGLDRIAPVPAGASSGHWRANANWWGNWNGGRDPVNYWKNGGRDAELYYAEQLIWYDQELQKDASVLGATIFTVGSNNSAWDGFNIDGTRVGQRLVQYIRDQAGAKASVAPAPVAPAPVAPSQPAPKPSPIVITPPAQGNTSGINLLRNANFASHAQWKGVPEIVIPTEWDFWYQTDKQLRLERQDQPFDPPESMVWNSAGVSAEDKARYFLSGENCLKVFKPWGVIWWRLFQKVTGLTPGQRYRFTVPIYPDLVMKTDAAGGKVWADDPLAGEVRLTVTSGGQAVETGWLDGHKFAYGHYTPFTLDFVAKVGETEVSMECRGRWGVLNNGWFCNGPKLEAVGSTASAAAKPGGLLQNPNFTGGLSAPQANLPGVQAPVGWTLWCADEQTQKLAKQTESFRPPRAGIITAATVAADDKDGLAGGLPQAYRLVGNWRAIWFSLSQKVTGLTPGQRYTFSVQMMPDPVDKYVPPNNTKQFVADPDGGEVWLKAQSGGQNTVTLKRVNADFKPGGYITFSHDFTASGSEATVSLEVRARFALTQNAWYVVAANLSATSP